MMFSEATKIKVSEKISEVKIIVTDTDSLSEKKGTVISLPNIKFLSFLLWINLQMHAIFSRLLAFIFYFEYHMDLN